jgi:hypothetical protein
MRLFEQVERQRVAGAFGKLPALYPLNPSRAKKPAKRRKALTDDGLPFG